MVSHRRHNEWDWLVNPDSEDTIMASATFETWWYYLIFGSLLFCCCFWFLLILCVRGNRDDQMKKKEILLEDAQALRSSFIERKR